MLNDDGTPSDLQTYSDFIGYYQVPTVPQGQRTVTFSKQHYITHSIQLFITNSNYQYNVGLILLGVPCPGLPTITDSRNGKIYNTVQIENQCWLRENMDIGTRIDGTLDQNNNNIIEKYCYDNNPANCTTYGGLYQWNEAMQYVSNVGAQGICPIGWHIPSMQEYTTLKTSVLNDGNALKAIGQGSSNGAGTNTSGFSAMLGGGRWGGYFAELGWGNFWMSSLSPGGSNAYYFYLQPTSSTIYIYPQGRGIGYSIRCIKD